MHKIFDHGLPVAIAPRLWEVRGTLAFPLERKMVVHELDDGTLLLHSVVAMNDEGMRALEALGRPSVMVVPHSMHTLDAPFYAARYPDMKVFTTEGIAKKLGDKVRVDGAPEEALAPLGVKAHRVAGMKFDEIVLDVPTGDGDGRALLFTDCVGRGNGKGGLMMKLLGPPAGEGVARIFKLRQMAKKAELRAFLESMAATPNLKMVMGSQRAGDRRPRRLPAPRGRRALRRLGAVPNSILGRLTPSRRSGLIASRELRGRARTSTRTAALTAGGCAPARRSSRRSCGRSCSRRR